jgi:hypothetical protein
MKMSDWTSSSLGKNHQKKRNQLGSGMSIATNTITGVITVTFTLQCRSWMQILTLYVHLCPILKCGHAHDHKMARDSPTEI